MRSIPEVTTSRIIAVPSGPTVPRRRVLCGVPNHDYLPDALGFDPATMSTPVMIAGLASR